MRIALERLDPVLAAALTDLLEQAGHEVRPAAEAAGPVALTIRGAAGEAVRPPAPGALLCLRPAPGSAPSADPAGDLRRALAEGGQAVWAPPLDPSRLLDVLALPAGPPVVARTEPAADLFGGAADAWFLLDAASLRLEPLNHEARLLKGPGGAGARRGPSAAALAAIAGADEGRRLVEDEPGQEALAVWWTPRPGRRLLGWIPWHRVEQAEDRGTLKALADLGRISSTFAHEVRNPLASLSSALDLLRSPGTDADRADVVALAQQRLSHLRLMLDDTLRLVRPFRGPPQPVDLAEVIASARALARSDPLFAGLTLAVEGPDPLPQPLSYAEPLRQALTNLLMNAAQAQGHQGRLRILVERREGRVLLAVADEGPGIPVEQRQRVFEPFWTTKHQGTGLGLSFVRRLAEASGGSARVAEVGPPGARLELDLPAAPEPRP